jgi:putative N6-adenine-specific DNA methylase
MLRAAAWDGERPFLDPMCGSGTLAIEAALAAGRRAPGLGRHFAFEDLPGHETARTERLRAHLAAMARPIRAPLHASDRNAGALRLAQKNAAAAGLEDAIRFTREDAARVVPPPGPGLCAANPPWGVRLDEEARAAWTALGALLGRLGGWDAVILGPDRGFEKLLPLSPGSTLALRAGGVACRLLRFERLAP